jgi:hypothetical protein
MQTTEVTILVPVTTGVYQSTTDLVPTGTETHQVELTARVTFSGKYSDATVVCVDYYRWLDAMGGPREFCTEAWQGAEERAIDAAAQKAMAARWNAFADALVDEEEEKRLNELASFWACVDERTAQ